MLAPIVELDRLEAISPLPHSIAGDGTTLWIASRETKRIDVVDRNRWVKTGELEPAGMPWGMAFGNGALYMTCGEGPDDNRNIHRYVPGKGFDPLVIACPDDTGSHLTISDGRVLLAQWYNRRLLVLDESGKVHSEIHAPHGIAGVAEKDGAVYLLGTDEEEHGEYYITRIDLKDLTAKDVALVPFHARGLAWDGKDWWTNHREAHKTVRFALPKA
jgi:hypothetical protein